MIKHIDIFMPPISEFGVIKHFTKQFHEALLRTGIKSRLLVAEKNNPKAFFDQITQSPPDCTLSFNGLLPDDKGHFLCEMLQIPHVAYLVDSPIYYVPLTQSPLNIITCPDRFFVSFYQNLEFQNAFFMPQAVEKDVAPEVNLEDRQFDVTFLGSCFDVDQQKAEWKKRYPDYLAYAIELAAEIAMSNVDITITDALVQAMNERVWFPGAQVEQFNFLQVLDDLEYYMRAIDRNKLLQSITDAPIHIFSPKENTKNWQKVLGNRSNVTYHGAVPFEDALEVMKNSKIVLNSTPTLKNGGHERIFSGLACGALVLTNQSIYLQEEGFKDKENILFYNSGKFDDVNDKVNTYLANKALRENAVILGRNKVLKNHTWDNRATQLLKQLDPLLSQVKQSIDT